MAGSMRLNIDDDVIVVRGKHAGSRGRVTSLSAGPPRSDKIAVALDHPVQRMLGPAISGRFDVVRADGAPGHAAFASIRWVRAPGRVASITRTPGGGVFARSADGRFVIWVRRYLGGDPGARSYRYYFAATDYG